MVPLKISDVKKSFQSTEILKGISLDVEPGEFIVLVGPSGCGKSTLLNIIAGLEDLTSGEVYIDSRPLTGVSPKDRDIAMVFQSYALYPNMTVRKNISFGLENRKTSKELIEKTITEVAAMLRIENLLDRKPSQLSGGQRQRVAIGRALARHPKVFLFDEPLSNLDAKLRVDMRSEIKNLHHRVKATAIYVTHDQVEAMTLADRIAIMKGGVLQQFDTPAEVYRNPQNLFVASFIGSPSMNFIPFTPKATDGGIQIDLSLNKTESLSFNLDDRFADLTPWVGKEILLGVRPEHIANGFRETKSQDRIISFTIHVTSIEPTGADTQVGFDLGGHHVIGRVSPAVVQKIGDHIPLFMDRKRLCFFDPKTEMRIGLPPAP